MLIETLDESVRRRITECTEESAKTFQLSVRPIYASTDGTKPKPIGSCVLLLVEGKRYVVTAAHVIDWLTESALYVGGLVGQRLVQIVGDVSSTRPPAGGRRRDRWDFAFWPISAQSASELGDVRFADANDLSLNRASPTNRIYMAVGYPVSRNKRKIYRVKRKIKMALRKYSSKVLDLPELAADLQVSGNDHFFLQFEKRSQDSEGRRVTTFNPVGMSGGAFVDLGNFASATKYLPESDRKGKLAGILIEHHKKHGAIVAVKIQSIVRAIRRAA